MEPIRRELQDRKDRLKAMVIELQRLEVIRPFGSDPMKWDEHDRKIAELRYLIGNAPFGIAELGEIIAEGRAPPKARKPDVSRRRKLSDEERNTIAELERENMELKNEMQTILGPLEHKVKEVTDLNMKYEKKLKTSKHENEQLQAKLQKIEEELDNMTTRGYINKQQSADDLDRKEKVIESYERRLQDKEREIRNLKKLRRSRDEDLKAHLKNKKILEERSVESGSLDEINASNKNSARRTEYSLGVHGSNNIHIIGSKINKPSDLLPSSVKENKPTSNLESSTSLYLGNYKEVDSGKSLEDEQTRKPPSAYGKKFEQILALMFYFEASSASLPC